MNETKQKAMPMKAITILIGVLVGVILGAHKVMFNPTDSRQYMLTLFANGMSENGVNVMLDPTVCEHSLSAWAANLIGDFNESCIACTFYDETGGRVETCDDVRSLATPGNSSDTSQLSLYVVPPEKWFVFPTMELGRAVAITRIEPPRGSGYPITVETLSHSPRAYHLHNFITESEADELISYALQNDDPVMGLQRSTTGAEHQVSFNKVRTSENAFDSVSPTARRIKKRAIDLLGMQPYDDEMTDGLQVLRYNMSTAYITHTDYLEDNGSGHDYDSAGKGSNRFATILFYLSDVEDGGETLFERGKPVDDGQVDKIDGITALEEYESDADILKSLKRGDFYKHRQRRNNQGNIIPPDTSSNPLSLFKQGSWEERMVGQCRSKLAVRPRKAHAVLFYSQHPDGSLDPMSKHGGCPVVSGTKWAANLWIWNKVRLGYPRAPRKEGASEFDRKKGIGRDRMKADAVQAETSTDGVRTAIFRNTNVPKAKLYFEDQFMADLPIGGDLRYNSYKGHHWKILNGNGDVVLTAIMNDEATQTFTATKSR